MSSTAWKRWWRNRKKSESANDPGRARLQGGMKITDEVLVGAWALVSWQIDYGGRRPATFPFGEDAQGLLIYAQEGWMSATMSFRRRTAFDSGSARQASIETRARAAEEYLAYSARWRIEGETVVHEVALSLNPSLIGTDQVREAKLLDGQLQLSAYESAAGANQRVHRLLWRRVDRSRDL